ncbi:MAG TPA: PAS domain S-box protein, partial [Firmicutes bacterium]|nr:PAS domain S-box protein [Bacillota bacterium]
MPKRCRYAIVVLCLIIGLVLTDFLLDVFGEHPSPGFFPLKQTMQLGVAAAGIFLIFWIVADYRRKRILLIDDEILERYFEVARVAAVFLKPDFRIYYANPMLCRIIGCEMEDLVGEIWHDLFTEDSRDAARRFLEGFVRGDSESNDCFEASLPGKDGKLYTLSWHNTAIRDSKGKLLGIISLGQDIT